MNTPLLIIFIVTQVIDGWLTWKILQKGGRELNPLMARLMENLGDKGALILTKSAAISFLGYLCVTYPDDQNLLLTMLFINVGYILIINHNWQQYEERK